jgi:hypothetical protein
MVVQLDPQIWGGSRSLYRKYHHLPYLLYTLAWERSIARMFSDPFRAQNQIETVQTRTLAPTLSRSAF